MNAYEFFRNNESGYIHSMNPVIEAERSYEANERAYWRRVARNAHCAACGVLIEEERCTVLSEYEAFETCICPECTKEQLAKAKAVLDPIIYETFENIINDMDARTPERGIA